MTIALAAIETDSLDFQAAALALVAVGITVLVYGSVALIVKADDIGLHMGDQRAHGGGPRDGARDRRRHAGFLKVLTIVGTLAMLWVGGSIITHSLAGMGWHGPEEVVHTIAHAFEPFGGFIEWLAGAALHGATASAVMPKWA
jgi:predicted DNA repair protein MutK